MDFEQNDAANAPDKSHNQTSLVDVPVIAGVDYVDIEILKGYRRHARTHPKKQQKAAERIFREVGVRIPVLAEMDGTIISGHLRVLVAKKIGYTKIPVIWVRDLSPAQIRAFRLADNRLAELGEWDQDTLALELQDLIELDYDLDFTGFEPPEVDVIIDGALGGAADAAANDIPEPDKVIVSKLGDTWLLDEHRVVCGDARDSTSYDALLQGRLAQLTITDVPYGIPIAGNVSGLGKIKHDDFVMGAGEMSEAELEAFFYDAATCAVRCAKDGSLGYWFIDWRNLHVLECVLRQLYTRHMNTCVWAKSNGGMGSLYRSRHELVLVFKKGTAPHVNNIQLGKYGRNRTNVWEYDGCSTGTKDRRADLALHPTVKPAEMIADAIKDASTRGGLILDPFLGSGTTIIACEMTGRICAGLELDPKYVDVIVRRWEAYTGGNTIHAETGLTFAEMRELRNGKQLLLPPPAAAGEV